MLSSQSVAAQMQGGASGEHSCATSLMNHGHCSFLTVFGSIKAQQLYLRESAASGGPSRGAVSGIPAFSCCDKFDATASLNHFKSGIFLSTFIFAASNLKVICPDFPYFYKPK